VTSITVSGVPILHGRVINKPQRAATQGDATMTAFSINTVRQIGFALAIAASTTAISTESFAYTAEAQQMCTGDAFRLCSSEIPNISKITSCMRTNRAKLSVGCRQVMDKDDAAARSSKVASK
jgi:hypothetical protein